MKRDPAVLKKVSVSLPFGIGSAEWQADDTERRAAWSQGNRIKIIELRD